MPSGVKIFLVEQDVERLARGDFDDGAEDVGRSANSARPCRRIEGEGEGGDGFREVERGPVEARVAGLHVHLAEFGFLVEHAVDEARLMAHEIAHGDLAGGRVRLALAFEDFRVGEFGNVFRDRIFEPELAFLDQLHGGDGNDRLRHRIDAEDGLGRHRVSIARAFRADRGDVHDFPALGDEEDRAGDLAGLHVGFEIGLSLREDCGIEAELRRSAAIAMEETAGSATVGAGGGVASAAGLGASGEQATARAMIAAEAAAKRWRFMECSRVISPWPRRSAWLLQEKDCRRGRARAKQILPRHGPCSRLYAPSNQFSHRSGGPGNWAAASRIYGPVSGQTEGRRSPHVSPERT